MTNRAIITFSEKCKLACGFCYSPFNYKVPTYQVMGDILSFCSDNDISVITFAGGDPFQYGFFRASLVKAKEKGFVVHVDTNGLDILPEDYSIIHSHVDILGLPIDGDASTHNRMRRAGHYEIVVNCIDQLIQQGTRVKVNTLVTAINERAVEHVQAILIKKNISIWSIYQFMPLGNARNRNERYGMSHDHFKQIVSKLDPKELPFRLEIGGQYKRQSDYLFIQTDGSLLTHDPESPSDYLPIGNIYSNDWRSQYGRNNKAMLPELCKDRYSPMNS
ncbi:MAG: radical SAM protein [Deltaproteobacteria bacterium]|nr:radical SAM protein [Deltaproteobacteria bacterium]